MAGRRAEQQFASFAKEASFGIRPSPSIRAPHPVPDKLGRLKKTVTTPDFLIVHLGTGETMFVEVTEGMGWLPSKEAQLGVIQAAGVKNYIWITAADIAYLQTLSPQEKRAYLCGRFHWKP